MTERKDARNGPSPVTPAQAGDQSFPPLSGAVRPGWHLAKNNSLKKLDSRLRGNDGGEKTQG